MQKKSALKELIKKLPFSVKIYLWLTETLPFLFYRGPEVLTIQGSKMYLNVWEPDTSIRRTFRAYAKNGIHEPRTTQFIREILKEGDVFIDLGANIGYFSMLASLAVGPKGKVFSFEPEQRNFKFLSKNRDLNNYSHMKPVNMAVSNKRDKVTLYVCPYDTGHHTIQQSEGITSYTTPLAYDRNKLSTLEIETIPLDDFLATEGISEVDLIKMDVEGAELLALQGMEKTVKSNDNIKIIFEFFPLLLDKMGSSPMAVLHLLTDTYGFHLYEISDDYSAEQMSDAVTLKKLNDPNVLIRNYEADKMYHINIFAIKPGNKEHRSFIGSRS